MLTVKEMVSGGKQVRFSHYAKGELWYATEDGFAFPVPISDTGDGAFKNQDRAMLFMRWIRKQVEAIQADTVKIEAEKAEAY